MFSTLKNLIGKISFLNKGKDNSAKNIIKDSTINAPVQQAQTIFNTTATPDRSDLVGKNLEERAKEIFSNTEETLKITFNVGDQDARKLADKLAQVFKELGWKIEGPIIDLTGSIIDGIHIRTNNVNELRQNFANLIIGFGFATKAYNNGTEDKLEIFIGRK